MSEGVVGVGVFCSTGCSAMFSSWILDLTQKKGWKDDNHMLMRMRELPVDILPLLADETVTINSMRMAMVSPTKIPSDSFRRNKSIQELDG